MLAYYALDPEEKMSMDFESGKGHFTKHTQMR